jgi:hypothetical protein
MTCKLTHTLSYPAVPLDTLTVGVDRLASTAPNCPATRPWRKTQRTNSPVDSFARHGSVADFLRASGFESTLEAFCNEAGVAEPTGAATNQLEKKWTAVVRLQKKAPPDTVPLPSHRPTLTVAAWKILDLEGKVEQLEEDLAQRGGKKGNKNSENLPKPVAKNELAGFRGVVSCVKFHPVVAVVVAAGEDGTVKVTLRRQGCHSCSEGDPKVLAGVGLREW